MSLKWSGLGMNIGGYGTIDSSFVANSITDLDELKKIGFTHVRMGNTDFSFTNATERAKEIVLYGISIGINMMWGPDQDSTITSSNWDTYHDLVITRFNDAITYGLHRFSIGNEMESSVDGSTMTITQLFDNLISLAEELQVIKASAESDMEITYNSTAGSTVVDLWGSKNLVFGSGGSFDYICFQPYGDGQTDISGFYTDCNRIWGYFGTDAKISEFNLVTDAGSLTISQKQQRREIDKRIAIIRGLGFEEAYFYTWKKTDDNEKLGTKYIGIEEYKQYYWSFISGREWFSYY